MHDLVIRGGTVIDGTGAARYLADVAVDNQVITAVQANVGPGSREIDARGLLVTPGFVDVHTHYDGQATWDPFMTPSSWHGVTTAVFGNCGVGFAPVRAESVPYLINLMEGVEDIPEIVLSEGIDFSWETFPQYLDCLSKMPRVIDIGAQVPHAPLRFYVMGNRGADHLEVPTREEILSMGTLLEEALNAGALGFTTSRTARHRAGDGRYIPSLSAHNEELTGIALAMKRAGKGVIEVNSDFAAGEFELMKEMAKAAGRPLSCLMLQADDAPGRWRETLAQIHGARTEGVEATAQVSCRPIGVLMGLETTMNPFADHPAWKQMDALSPRQRYERLLSDPALRDELVNIEHADPLKGRITSKLPRAHPMETLDYEPDPATSIGAIARSRGQTVRRVALDAMMADEGKALLLLPNENYHDGNLDAIHEMLIDEATIMGLADAGAHVGVICDASQPTLLLTHWTRDRKRGPKLSLEFVVHKQTQVTASAYGLLDRGVLRAGMKADINVIDYERLQLLPPEVVYDLPAAGRRIIQKAQGYRHVFVSGVETVKNDEFTGQLPGRLVRGSKPAPLAQAPGGR